APLPHHPPRRPAQNRPGRRTGRLAPHETAHDRQRGAAASDPFLLTPTPPFSGMSTTTRVPAPGWLCSISSPPSDSTRSRIPARPKDVRGTSDTASGSNPPPSSPITIWSRRASGLLNVIPAFRQLAFLRTLASAS